MEKKFSSTKPKLAEHKFSNRVRNFPPLSQEQYKVESDFYLLPYHIIIIYTKSKKKKKTQRHRQVDNTAARRPPSHLILEYLLQLQALFPSNGLQHLRYHRLGVRRGWAIGNREQRRERMGVFHQSPRFLLSPLRRCRQPQLPRHLRRRKGPFLLFHFIIFSISSKLTPSTTTTTTTTLEIYCIVYLKWLSPISSTSASFPCNEVLHLRL